MTLNANKDLVIRFYIQVIGSLKIIFSFTMTPFPANSFIL